MNYAMNYYPVHVGDTAKATGHLQPLGYGVYCRLRDKYMSNGGGIPVDLVHGWAVGARPTRDETAAVNQVLREFFREEQGMYRNDEFDAILGRYRDKQTKAKRSAEARWAHSEDPAIAMRTHSDGNANQKPKAKSQKEHTPGEAGSVCVDLSAKAVEAMREAGLHDAAHGNPHVTALVKLGVSIEQFAGAARLAASIGKGPAYAIGVIKGQLRDAAATATLPSRPIATWDSGRSTIEAKGIELGLGKWDESALISGKGESFAGYTARVRAALQEAKA